ncbi:cell division protein FtsQ/DivIB [Arthrobacter psychrochitiniphilus]|uniref:cell division protein FtsQ/DivIB n=1 Tax=Arthrobacter psychrochitiniphilus TaxID=291045 RepID=UPI003F7C67F2
MAEPRKPRVIRTRTPASPPASPRAGKQREGLSNSMEVPAGTGDSAATAKSAGSLESAGTVHSAGTVRGTSEKVAVVPVPSEKAKPFMWVPRLKASLKPASKTPDAKVAGAKTPDAKVAGAKIPAAPESRSGKEPAGKGSALPEASKPVSSEPVSKRVGSDKSVSSKAAAKHPTALASAGSEDDGVAQVLAFPMPEHKRRRRTFLISAAGVVAVLALVMGIALYSPVLGVKTVVFDGNKLVSEHTLQLALLPVMSRPLPQVTEADVQALLEPVVQVKSSRIEARPPSTLVVHVVERVPVALLKNGKSFSLVDQDGVELGTTMDSTTAALPLIDGGKAVIGKATFAAMTAVLATLPKSILTQLANATAKSPDAVELRLTDGRSVIWGNANDMDLKAQVLEALLNAPPPTAQEGKPLPVPAQVFDVSAPRHPVTR